MALEAQTNAALAGAYDEAKAAVVAAPVKNADETGWSEKGERRWLWTAATRSVAYFVIHLRRSFEGLTALLGETIAGVVTSDRWGAYSRLPLNQRQICWAGSLVNSNGVLEQGRCCADTKAAAFCANVLAGYPSWWLFAATEGVEPTNNHAERVLRSGVLWRKNAFGCHSAEGCRFAERMLTVVQTLRLQGRCVLEYLQRAIEAHRSGLPAPQFLS